jgi:ADP-heptose:LPS heptosyltransferase
MDLSDNVEDRVRSYRAKLELIDLAMTEELKKAFDQRRIPILQLLYAEKRACCQTLLELESLLVGSSNFAAKIALPTIERESIIAKDNAEENCNRNRMTARRIFRVVTAGGIGDALLLTPTIRTLKQQYPNCRIHVYYTHNEYREALMHNKYIDRLLPVNLPRIAVYHLLKWLNMVEVHIPSYWVLFPSLFYRKSAAEAIGEMLGIEVDDPRPDCFLTEEEEREAARIVAKYANPVALHVTASCSSNKNWPTENWENLVLNNPHYNFLQVGSANDEPIRGVIDLRGKIRFRQAIAIVKEVKAFVGVDSVFAHAAAAFQTPAVVLFGPSTPAVWGHATSKNLYNPPICSPCIDVIGRLPCPYGKTCMSNITIPDVERALSSLIATNG